MKAAGIAMLDREAGGSTAKEIQLSTTISDVVDRLTMDDSHSFKRAAILKHTCNNHMSCIKSTRSSAKGNAIPQVKGCPKEHLLLDPIYLLGCSSAIDSRSST